MESFIDGVMGRSKMVLTILLFSLMMGSIAYVQIPKNGEPDIDIPFIGVTVPLDGMSPEDGERLIARPLEREFEALDEVVELQVICAEGAVQAVVEFSVSFDANKALEDVKDKVEIAKAEFPEAAKDPIIQAMSMDQFPIIVLHLYGNLPERTLYKEALDVKYALESISGVLEANVRGHRDEFLEIVIEPAKIESYGLSLGQVVQAISTNNQLIPAGRLDLGEGRYAVKVPGLVETPEDLLGLPVARKGDVVVRLQDVATPKRTFVDREVYSRYNSTPSISLEISKRNGANLPSTVEEIRAVIETLKPGWPTGLDYGFTNDQAQWVTPVLATLESSIMTAVILVMIIVVAALGFRSAILVGLAIPSSFVLTFLLIGFVGSDINMMVMFGMVISVGILVDGAIVVVEYADRKMAEGLDKKAAYTMAAKRMFWPIVASNATTMAAFVPILFWDSLSGKFMGYLPRTLIYVLSASLLMALIFLPVIGSIFGARPRGDTSNMEAVSGAAGGDPSQATGFLGLYVRFISTLIRRPLTTTLVAFTIILSVFTIYSRAEIEEEFFIREKPDMAYAYIRARDDISAQQELTLVKEIEERFMNIVGVHSLSTRSGSSSREQSMMDGGGEAPKDTIGRILIEIKPPPGLDEWDVYDEVIAASKNIDGALVEMRKFDRGPPTSKDVTAKLRSENPEKLKEAAAILYQKFIHDPELKEVEDTAPLPGIEWRMKVDREMAAKFGVDVQMIGAAVQMVTNGILVDTYRPDDSREELDIRIRLPEENRHLAALDNLKIVTDEGVVPISTFVKREAAQRVNEVVRVDGARYIEVQANAVKPGDGLRLEAEMRDWVAKQNFDPEVSISFGGAGEDAAEAAAFFEIAGMVAIFLMAVILLWEFNNFYHVVLTLSAVVVSTTGVLVAHLTVLPYMSMLNTGIGIIALAGIVVNNNIVLIDTFQRLRREGRDAVTAAIATAAQRMRPILLTTVTTIIGMLPMALQISLDFFSADIIVEGQSSDWWVGLATCIMFGLGTSTLITLTLTPVWLTLPERLGKRRKAFGAWIGARFAGNLKREKTSSVPAAE